MKSIQNCIRKNLAKNLKNLDYYTAYHNRSCYNKKLSHFVNNAKKCLGDKKENYWESFVLYSKVYSEPAFVEIFDFLIFTLRIRCLAMRFPSHKWDDEFEHFTDELFIPFSVFHVVHCD